MSKKILQSADQLRSSRLLGKPPFNAALGGGDIRRRAVEMLIAAATIALPVVAKAGGPIQVANVAAGTAAFSQAGSVTTITAANNTIINYQKFGIPQGNTVNFIQPSASARVLNRIIGPTPTQIDGTLNANGVVYFVNPAGVMFGAGAVINVGQLYAAAGHMSDADFLSGVNSFTDNSGSITNAGVIKAGDVTFAAGNISNNGTILTPEGMVVMAAGKDVYVSKLGSPFLVQVVGAGNTNAKGATPGVSNSGTIDAAGGDVAIRAGDMYSLAINTSGTIKAANVSIQAAGADSTVLVSGKIDAANQGAGSTGGTISVSGGHIGIGATADATGAYHNAAATLDASGTNGGGKILIGVKPDATSATGYADASEYDYIGSNAILNASATSTGNGGLVDTSGQVLNISSGATITAAGAGGGNAGEWLLDPYNVTISNNASSSESAGPTFTPNASGANVDAATITSDLAGGTNVTVVTTGSGTDAGTLTIDSTVNINPVVTGSVTLTFSADSSIDMQSGASIAPTGSGTLGVTFTSGGDVTLGSIGTNGGNFSVTAGSLGSITIASGNVNSGTGTQTYNESVLLGQTSTTLTGSLVSFSGTVDAVTAGNNLTVTGDAAFGGNVGIATKLGTLDVLGTSSLDGNITTTNGQTYNGAVTLGANDTLTTSNSAVDLVSTVDAATANTESLTVAAGTGAVTFGGAVGGTNELASLTVTGPTGINGGVVTTGGTQTYNSAVTLGSNDTLTTSNSAVDFVSTVDAATVGGDSLHVETADMTTFNGSVGATNPLASLTVDNLDTTGGIVLMANVNATGNITLDSGSSLQQVSGVLGSLVPVQQPTVHGVQIAAGLVIDGNITSTRGTVSLGADIPVAEVPSVATIVTTNTTGTITVTGQSIAMGQNQKWTSLTSLTIGTSSSPATATATLGDLNVAGTLGVNAETVYMGLRPTGSVLFQNQSGSLGLAKPTPEGTDVVAESISFTGSLSQVGIGYGAQFATPTGTTSASGGQYIGNQEIHQYGPNITAGALTTDAVGTEYYLDLVASGPVTDNFIFVPPVATPPAQTSYVTTLSAAQRRVLIKAGINARNATISELLQLRGGDTVFNDIIPIKGRYPVTTPRLPYRETMDFIAMYRDLFLVPVIDPKTHQQRVDKQGNPVYRSRRMELHQLISNSYRSYVLGLKVEEKMMPARERLFNELLGKYSATPMGFRAWLEKTPSQAKVLATLNQLRALLAQAMQLGLTPVEMRLSGNTILAYLNPEALSESQFEEAVLGRKLLNQ